MNIETVRDFCMSLPEVTEGFPFDESTLVFKTNNKMFCFTNLYDDFKITLKCKPEDAIEIRENFRAVIPGYHMNKKHWNTIYIDGSISDNLIKKWIQDSYNLVRIKK